MYNYKPVNYRPKVGDIVDCINPVNSKLSMNTLYIVKKLSSSGIYCVWDNETSDEWFFNKYFKVLETKAGTEAKVGDTCIVIEDHLAANGPKKGTIFKVETVQPSFIDTDIIVNGLPYTYGIDPNKVRVLCKEKETVLLHQEWKELYDSGIELEYAYKSYNTWCAVQNKPDCAYFSFNNPNYKYRRKEPTMQIRDYIIDIKDSTLANRLRLRQVLLDNSQRIHSTQSLLERNPRPIYGYSTNSNEWTMSANLTKSNITIADFITKFKKSDKVRNLAFYKKSDENWTYEEYELLYEFVGDSGSKPICTDSKWIFYDYVDYYNWSDQEGNSNFKNCLQVAYEDLFPETVVMPNEPIIDIDYWQERYGAGYDVWVELIDGTVVKCEKASPIEWVSPVEFYDHDPDRKSVV